MLNSFTEVKEKIQESTMPQNTYWNLIIDNSNLIFWEVQERSKVEVAKDLNMTQGVFSTIYKVVAARASK